MAHLARSRISLLIYYIEGPVETRRNNRGSQVAVLVFRVSRNPQRIGLETHVQTYWAFLPLASSIFRLFSSCLAAGIVSALIPKKLQMLVTTRKAQRK